MNIDAITSKIPKWAYGVGAALAALTFTAVVFGRDTSTPQEKAGTPAWKPADFRQLASIARSFGMNPEDLLAVLYSESGLDPTARNPAGSLAPIAIGLNQLTSAANSLVGITEAQRITLSSQPVSYQLELVRRYFAGLPYTKNGGTYPRGGIIYTANFAPNKLLAGTDPSNVLYTQGVDGASYDLNSALDFGNKGYITIGDMDTQVNNVKNRAGYQLALSRLKKSTSGLL
jgi:hypothetical protein